MARVKNASFQGLPPIDWDVDAKTFGRCLEIIQGDAALIYDKMTGENGEANTCNHTGAPNRGARLGMPLLNQILMADPTYYMLAKGSQVLGELIAPTPVFLATGEDTLEAIVQMEASFFRAEAVLYDAAYTEVARQPFIDNIPDDVNTTFVRNNVVARALFRNLTSGDYIFVIENFFWPMISDDDENYRQPTVLKSLHLTPTRMRRPGRKPDISRKDDDYIGVTPNGSSPYVGGSALAFQDFDTAHFDDNQPISSFHVSRINRNINSLFEYAQRWPAGGNQSLAQTDASGTNPATSRFFANTRANAFGSEPLVDFNVVAETCGCGVMAYNRSTTEGVKHFYVPRFAATGGAMTAKNFWTRQANIPDFSSASILKCRVLVASAYASHAGWTVKATLSSGGVATATASHSTRTSILTTPYYLFEYKFNSIAFTPDALNLLTLTAEKTSAVLEDEFAVCGVCFYFEV